MKPIPKSFFVFALWAAALLVGQAAAQKPVTFTIGYQKGSLTALLKARGTLERAKAQGITYNWVLFTSGPPLLEALNAGAVDFGSVGDTPGVFALAGGADLKFVAVSESKNEAANTSEALIVKADSPIKTVADLKGKKIGVTAPGSSTNVMVNFVLAKAGLKPSDVSIIGVGAASGAVAAMRSGQIDAISNLDPVITLLQRSGDLRIVTDTRVVKEADQVFGGPMPAGCLYAPQAFLDRHPNTAQALTNAIVRANKWIQQAGPSDIVKAVPESYLLGDRAVYIDAFLAAKGALSPDGSIPEAGAETALRALRSIDESLNNVQFDLKAVYTNDFVKKANAKYPKA